jgi:hypothetical protein
MTNTFFMNSIQYLAQHNPFLDFVLDEVGCALGDAKGTTTPNYPLCASLGGAVWTVDWLLYAMSIVSHRSLETLLYSGND